MKDSEKKYCRSYYCAQSFEKGKGGGEGKLFAKRKYPRRFKGKRDSKKREGEMITRENISD